MEYKDWEIHLRKSSENIIPIEANTTTLLVVHGYRPRWIRQGKTVVKKLELLQAMGEDDIALVCWPGRMSQDVFVVTNAHELIARLKLFVEGTGEEDPAWRPRM